MNQSLNFIRATLAAAACLAALPEAQAQAFDAVRLDGAASGRDGGTVGLAVLAGTQYMGSDERRTSGLPILNYQWANGWFAGVTNGVGYNFSASSDMQYGIRVTADIGRKESRSNALRGLGDIDPSGEVGGFFNYLPGSGISLTTSLRYGSGNDGKGLLVDLGAGYSTQLAPQWRISVGAALTVANADYMQAYFGVNDEQAKASGYRVFRGKAFVRDMRASVAVTYQYDNEVSFKAALSSSTLAGDAADSPMTREKTSGNALLAVSYAF